MTSNTSISQSQRRRRTSNIPALTPQNTTQALTQELQLEQQYAPVGLALNISGLMSLGFTYQNYTKQYSVYSEKQTLTPSMFIELEQHVRGFIEKYRYPEDKAKACVVYVVSRIWRKKLESNMILAPSLIPKMVEAEAARQQKADMHKAINRLAKNKSEDSFEAGMKANFTQVLEDAGAHQLRALTDEVRK